MSFEILTGWGIIIGVVLNNIAESKGVVLSLDYKGKRKSKEVRNEE